MYTRKKPIKIGEGEKTTWFSGGKFSIYPFFREEISVYTHYSGGKNEYWGKMSIQHRSIKQSIKQQKRDKQNIVPRGNTG